MFTSMKFLCCIFLILSSVFCSAQTTHIKKEPLKADVFIGIDLFENLYYLEHNKLVKKGKLLTEYTNYKYGRISSVDISNPLKIIVFYQNFNTVIILDNRLNEIETIQLSNNIKFVQKGNNDLLFLYNTDSRKVESYNYKTNSTESSTQPLTFSSIKDMKSNLNTCAILTSNGIETYDYLGNFMNHNSGTNIKQFQINKNRLYTLSNNKIYRIHNKTTTLLVKTDTNIKNFYVFNSNIYIFDGTQIFHFLINKND